MENKTGGYLFKSQVETLFKQEYSRENRSVDLFGRLEHALEAAYIATEEQSPHIAGKSIKLLEEIVKVHEYHCGKLRASIDTLLRDITEHYNPACIYVPVWDSGEQYSYHYDNDRELLQIQMEGMLPFAMNSGANYLSEKLQRQLNQYLLEYEQSTGTRPMLSPALVVFVHHYDRQRIALNHVRDYDNQERRRIINAIQNTRLLSDNPIRMVDMNVAVADDSSFTELLITKVRRMHELLETLDLSLYESL